MSIIRILGLAMIIGGAVALAYGEFSFTSETHRAALGPFELEVNETETVDVPKWVGIGVIAVGGVLLLIGGRKR